jgi:hypothetical protein
VGNPSALRDPVALTVGALAVYRLTRLLVEDKIAEPVRDRLAEDAEGRLAYFVTCPWCVSMWVAAGWAGLTVAAPAASVTAGAVLAWSAVSGLLSSWE